jgi:hypothetical protein
MRWALLVLSSCATAALVACGGASSSAEESNGASAALEAAPYESGFVDVEPQATASRHPARLWYALQRARSGGSGRPIFLFFNGGPGAATSAHLWVHGTGNRTIDVFGTRTLVVNEDAWTDLGHLLYVDARQTGFSYELSTTPVASFPPSSPFSPGDDAVDFLRVLLRVLRAHPDMRSSPVVMVGESYGGLRAGLMLRDLHAYRSAPIPDSLRAEIQEHFEATLTIPTGTPPSPEQIAKQFGRQVLIQPLVSDDQLTVGDVPAAPPCAGAPEGTDTTEEVMADVGNLELLLGVPLASVAKLQPSERRGGFRTEPFSYASVRTAIERTLGPLGSGDHYFADFSRLDETNGAEHEDSGALFIDNLGHVDTFITNARCDTIIEPEAIPTFLERRGFPVTRGDEAFTVDLGHGGQRTVRFPVYLRSRHEVAGHETHKLHGDVARWLVETPQ